MAEDNFFGGIKLIGLEPFSDERGIFTELYNKKVFQNFDIECDFVQDNLSESINKNTIRGLHFQNPPYEQAKLVKVISGEAPPPQDIRMNANNKVFFIIN